MSQQVELLAGERQNGESNKAVQACNDYLRLGAGRSLAKLLSRYQSGTEAPPTKRLNTLKEWSGAYDWQDRAETFDAGEERQKNERRRQALETGLALDYERVLELKRLANFLRDQVYEQGETGIFHNVWVPDVKQIGGGLFAEKVDIERYNSAIIDNLRGVLDDLARETGGRKQKVDITWRDKLPPGRDPDEVLRQFTQLMILAQKQKASSD